MLHQLLHADVSVALLQDSDGNTPLHLLCKLKGEDDDEGLRATMMDIMRKQLLDTCPAAAMIANTNGSLPLHCVFYGDSDTGFLQQLIAAYPEGLQCGDNDGFLPAHCAAQVGTLGMLTTVLDAYPEAASSNVAICGTPLHQVSFQPEEETPDFVRYLYERYPAAIKTPRHGDGWYPLHCATESGSNEVLKLVHTLYPDSISIATTDGHKNLPLHILFAEGHFESPLSADADMLRYLLRHYPAAATIPAGPRDENMNPYQLAVKYEYPDFVRRLLLRAAPELDPDELHRLNYEERRIALFLVHCAISNGEMATRARERFVLS
jgi:ankyrin repeat protein